MKVLLIILLFMALHVNAQKMSISIEGKEMKVGVNKNIFEKGLPNSCSLESTFLENSFNIMKGEEPIGSILVSDGKVVNISKTLFQANESKSIDAFYVFYKALKEDVKELIDTKAYLNLYPNNNKPFQISIKKNNRGVSLSMFKIKNTSLVTVTETIYNGNVEENPFTK